MQKYELIQEDQMCVLGKTLKRIKACKDFTTFRGDVIRKGDRGGYVENESNLSQEGNCWIFESGTVTGNATVTDNAIVEKGATVKDNAVVKGNAVLYGYTTVKHNAVICDNVRLGGVVIDGYRTISGNIEAFSEYILENALKGRTVQTY